MAIYDTMQFVRAPVAHDLRRPGRVRGRGHAGRRRSRSAILAAAHPGAAAPTVRRRAGHHLGSVAAGTGGAPGPGADGRGAQPAHRAETWRTLRADTDRDKIFTAEQAIAYGLADQIIPARKAFPAAVVA